MARFFLTTKNSKGVESCLVISDVLQNLIDYIRDAKYMPSSGYLIYSSHEAPVTVNYVDGKVFIQ